MKFVLFRAVPCDIPEVPLPSGRELINVVKRRRMPRRLVFLISILALVILGGAAHRLWFSNGHERALEAWPRERLERDARSGSANPLVYHALARKQMEAGEFPTAAASLENALRLRPNFARARATLGTVLMALDRDPEAALQLKRAVEDDPTNPDGYLGLALLYQRHESWKLQGQAAEAAAQLDPRSAPARILWGEALGRQGDHTRAAEVFEQAAALDPREARARALASVHWLAAGDFDRAERLAVEATRAGPKDPGAHTALGQALLKKGPAQYGAAERAFAAAVSFGDETGHGHLGLARCLALQNRPVEAEPQFRLAIRSHPELTEAHYGLAQALRAQGKTASAAAAEREFRRWVGFKEEEEKLHDRIAIAPNRPEAWFTLARLYSRMGLRSDARRFTMAGLRRAPAHPQGQALLRQLEADAS